MGQVISIGFRGTAYVKSRSPDRTLRSAERLSTAETQLLLEQQDWNAEGRTVVRDEAQLRRDRHREHLRAARNAHYRAELERLGLL